MTTAYLTQIGKFRGVNNAGGALVGGLVYTYAAGTTTPIATYTDSTAGTPNANPVVLNARGEADIWLKPNTGYKFVLTDQYGALIWSEDNVFLSQLLSLYGGVDTGSANSYVINFAANFTSLTDGIYIIWFPSNANTSASQINVNGLGNIAIVNADGSALVANEILANNPAYILYKGGQWILTNPNPINQVIIKYKAAQTIRTTTVLSDDPDLLYSIQTTGTYLIEVNANFNSGGSIAGADTAGYKFAMNYTGTIGSGTSNCSGNYTSQLTSSVIPVIATFFNGFSGEVLTVAGVSWSNRPSDYVNYKAVLNATTTGTLTVQWAQAVATFSTQLRQGSFMRITKIA